MHRLHRIAVAAAAAGLSLATLPGVASAAGPVQLNGWVTRIGLSDPFPNPTASYKGFVDAAGNLTVEPDCVKNALVPSVPCQSTGGTADTMRWQNVTTGASGTTAFSLGRAHANPGKGTVNIQVTGGFGVVGTASGTYTA